MIGTLILMRHGQSIWNQHNLFTGWVDIPLSEKGIQEALQAGQLIKDLQIDVIFTSSLIRAIMTAMLAMASHKSGKTPIIQHPGEGELHDWAKSFQEDAESSVIPVFRSSNLNERMYGKLQGLNKAETIAKYGEEQVKLWRRSYDVAPPQGESLEMTAKRCIPYFTKSILPFLEQGKHVLVSAHGNSLRSIIMYLENLSREQIVNLELDTGIPILYAYKEGKFVKKELIRHTNQ